MKNDNSIYDEIKKILADRFVDAIVNTQMKQSEIARHCGISRQTLQKYMKGENTIPVNVTMTVSELSNIESCYLLGQDCIEMLKEQKK